jgi:hypothetical protein
MRCGVRKRKRTDEVAEIQRVTGAVAEAFGRWPTAASASQRRAASWLARSACGSRA